MRTETANLPPYGNGTLAPEVRSRAIAGVNGLTVHILEAGYKSSGRPAVLLLHGFPELAYSWRKVMPPLAAAGYHVIAPDQRGYGRTMGWDDSYDADPDAFRILNMVRDAVGLVFALGYRQVTAVVGHDAGSPVAAWSALIRPDIFRSVVMMSSPFAGVPALPFNTANGADPPRPPVTDDELDAELAKLVPPRKYYQNYQRTPGANDDMLHAPQGLHAFFRAYYHYKSADWAGNKPHPLKARTAEEMAQIPTYYVMERDKGMAATVAPMMPSAAEIAACKWLTEAEVEVYATEYARTLIHRRPSGLSGAARLRPQEHRRDAYLCGPHHRCAVVIHRRQERLGRLSDPGRGGEHAEDRVHPDARLSSGGWSRALGAAGAAR